VRFSSTSAPAEQEIVGKAVGGAIAAQAFLLEALLASEFDPKFA
jgi:hypothetical protein